MSNLAEMEFDITEKQTPVTGPSFASQMSILQAQFAGLSGPVVSEWVQQRRQNIQPWSTFFNTSNFRTPPSLKRLYKRAFTNIEYFKSNYLFVYIGLVLYCLITSLLLLLAVAASAGAAYILTVKNRQGDKFLVFGKELSLGQQYGLVALFSLPVFYWVGAGAALFWVLGVSFLLIGLHASFYNIDNVLNPEGEQFGLEQV